MAANHSIKRKLTTVILITISAVLVLTCGTYFSYELLTSRDRLAGELLTIGRVITANSTAALAFENPADATEVLSALAADRRIVSAGLFDQSGILFAKYPSTAADEAMPDRLERDGYEFSATHLVLQEPVTSANRRLGTLVMKSDLAVLNQQLLLVGGLAVVAVALSGLVVVPLSARLQRHVSQPVQELANIARAVSERQDYSVRAAKFRDDELGRLVDAFNDMLAQIQRQENEVRALNASLEQRVQERTVALEQANKELESFSYSVSHDLRAPLRHVQGYVDMLQRATEGQLHGNAERYLRTICEASVEMGRLIDDLLAFSRMARTEMSQSRVDLDAIVRDVIEAENSSSRDRVIEWRTTPLPPVLGDTTALRQVMVNLIGNAVKYSRGRDPARIEIGNAGYEDGRIIMFVRDNGAGFDMRYAHKLFGVFQRLHRAEDFEGTGIGLAIVSRIVARHGGRVWAEGALNEGATFYFTLQPSRSREADATGSLG